MLTIDREKAHEFFAQRYAKTPKLCSSETDSRPYVAPRFRIKHGSKVVCIGNCFTRRIESLLFYEGFDVPWKRLVVPASELTHGSCNQLIHKHTPAAVFEEIHWAVDLMKSGKQPQFEDCQQFALECENGRVVDVALTGLSSVTIERFIERRVELFDILRELATCDCLLLSFSEVESWFDTRNQICVYHKPHEKDLAEGRYVYRVFDYCECLDYAEKTLALVREINPGCKVLLAVSPNRMRYTATGDDVLLATENSKAALRTLCSELYLRHDFVDYIPIYELVSAEGRTALGNDGIHIETLVEKRAVISMSPNHFEIEGHRLLFKQAQTCVTQYHRSETPSAEALEQALWLVRNALKLRPDAVEYMRLAAHVLNMQGNRGEAEDVLREALQLEPNDSVSMSMLGIVLACEGHIDQALELTARAVERGRDAVKCWLNYAQVSAKAGRLDKSEQQFRKAIELNPALAWPWAALAEILLQAGKADDALAAAAAAVRLESESIKYNNLHARVLLKTGRTAAAKEILEKALAAKVASAETLSLLSAAERSLGDLNEALLNAAQAVELRPESSEFRREYAALLTDAGRLEEAKVQLAIADESVGMESTIEQ